jgi:uncharacterized protein (TIGR02001 family)
MKLRLLQTSLLLVALPIAGTALAQAANDADYTITGNAAVVSDYMFRGISQTWGEPAIQGGGDLTMKNGFAAGFWASSISKNSYPGGAMELDLYGSYGANFDADWSWRVGLYGYVYPGGGLDKARPPLPNRSFNTLEANAALTWKWLTLKYNYSLTDYFAIDTEQGFRGDSKGTQYIQLDATIPLADQWSLALHAAHTDIPTSLVTPLPGGHTDPSYNDYGATLKFQFHPNWSVSGGVTNASNSAFYGHTVSFRNPNSIHDCGGTRGFVMLQATF